LNFVSNYGILISGLLGAILPILARRVKDLDRRDFRINPLIKRDIWRSVDINCLDQVYVPECLSNL